MTQDSPLALADERRALDADELGLADMTRFPVLSALADAELASVIDRLRDRRNRARDLADRQAREARSKVEPKGATAAAGDAGMRAKHDFLGAALDRALAERERRAAAEGAGSHRDDKAESQADLARKALAMKQAGEAGPSAMAETGATLHPRDPEASAGKAGLADTARKIAPSGALDHAGELPSRERSRTRY
ncbi:hypothetical protein [Rhodobacter calidifons]|uniref:Uncharacterized protein n=1 Tax=Rhodobacter calidifons TaxID=2715277 RepID=A0ABX0G6N2_9RHOB|nr:hypothetical protein [Rhodobacter calidifons]NHB76514.1 hypothetical protein [Rhodobacter calidifons]